MSFYGNMRISDAVDAMTDLSIALADDDYVVGAVNVDDDGYMDDGEQYICDRCHIEHDDDCPELVALLGSM